MSTTDDTAPIFQDRLDQMSIFNEASSRLNSSAQEDPMMRLRRELKESSQRNRLRLATAAAAVAGVVICCAVVYNMTDGKVQEIKHRVAILEKDLEHFKHDATKAITSVDSKTSSSSSKSSAATSPSAGMAPVSAMDVLQLKAKMSQVDGMLEDLERVKQDLEDKSDALQTQLDQLATKVYSLESSSPSAGSTRPLLPLPVNSDCVTKDKFRTKTSKLQRQIDAVELKVSLNSAMESATTEMLTALAAKQEEMRMGLANVSAAVLRLEEAAAGFVKQDKLKTLIAGDQATLKLLESRLAASPSSPSSSADVPVHISVKVDSVIAAVDSINATLQAFLVKAALGGSTPRTCQQLKDLGTDSSDYYFIDPDGAEVGAGPIRVYCNFEDGSTEVDHDSVGSDLVVDHCQSMDCFERTFDYGNGEPGRMDQIKTLVAMSEHCQQHFKFKCLKAPLKGHASWVDANGQANHYFDGSHQPDEHVCACADQAGNNTCKFSLTEEKCNCDVLVGDAAWESDEGTITNSSALPITAFRYGHLYKTSQASFQVGKLKCSGNRRGFGEGSTTCAELKSQGVRRSGYQLLSVSGHPTEMAKLTYCDMTSMEETTLRVFYGDGVNLKFEYYTTSGFKSKVIKPFKARKTDGDSYTRDIDDGTFKVGVSGKYKVGIKGSCWNRIKIRLQVNGTDLTADDTSDGGDGDDGDASASAPVVIYERDNSDENWRSCEGEEEVALRAGDRLGVAVKCPGTYWCTNSGKEFNFFGRLVA